VRQQEAPISDVTLNRDQALFTQAVHTYIRISREGEEANVCIVATRIVTANSAITSDSLSYCTMYCTMRVARCLLCVASGGAADGKAPFVFTNPDANPVVCRCAYHDGDDGTIRSRQRRYH
jgi:hypothetical protein